MPIAYSGSYAAPRLDLGQALMEYDFGKANYVADQVLPTIGVPRKSATFSVLTRDSLLRNRTVLRNSASGYNQDEFTAKDRTYTCYEYGLEVPVDDSIRNLYKYDFDADLVSAQVAANILKREREKRVATVVFDATTSNSSSMYTDYSSTAPWTTTTTDVLAQVNVARAAIRAATGMEANTILFNKTNLDRLIDNDDFVGRIQYTQLPDYQAVAARIGSILGIDKVLIPNTYYNSNSEGGAFSGSAVWSNLYAWVGITPTTMNIAEPCFGRSFLWTDDSPTDLVVESYRWEPQRATRIRVRHNISETVYDWYYGYLLKVAAS